jgi:hypothetical protein
MARGPAAPSNKDVQLYLDDKEGFWKKMRRMFQDKNIILRDVEERLGITKKEESAYYAKDAAYGKNEHELTYLQKQEVEPIVAKIEKSGGSLGLFSAYLYARHSGERNAVMKAEKGIDDGSGMQKYCLCNCTHDNEHGCHYQHQGHVHLTCIKCHETICLEDVPIPSVPIPEGYVVHESEYVIKGICPKCQGHRS